ncbi:MAG: DUF6095 family protein [Flavobacteriales bacterium]
MNKQKLANGVMWISMAVVFLFTASLTFYIGFAKDNLLLQALGLVFIACIFYFSYRGMKTILDAFFDKN